MSVERKEGKMVIELDNVLPADAIAIKKNVRIYAIFGEYRFIKKL